MGNYQLFHYSGSYLNKSIGSSEKLPHLTIEDWSGWWRKRERRERERICKNKVGRDQRQKKAKKKQKPKCQVPKPVKLFRRLCRKSSV